MNSDSTRQERMGEPDISKSKNSNFRFFIFAILHFLRNFTKKANKKTKFPAVSRHYRCISRLPASKLDEVRGDLFRNLSDAVDGSLAHESILRIDTFDHFRATYGNILV